MIKITYTDMETECRFAHEEVKVSNFPDNTLLLKTKNVDFYKPIDIEWYYENDVELFTIICLAKKALSKKTLFMPYCPHARQDRIKSEEDTFTLKYFAETINSLGFGKVTILDPHSNVCTALIDRVIVENPKIYIDKVIADINDSNLVLFFPDEGSMKRYSDMFNLPYCFGLKKRDWRTGQILGLDVIDNGIDLKDKTILIIDDISSRGGTFVHSSRALKKLNIGNVYLYVTHCENTILEGEIFTDGLIDRVFTTNSIFTKEHEKITVMEL